MPQGLRRISHELISISAVASALLVNSTETGRSWVMPGVQSKGSRGRERSR